MIVCIVLVNRELGWQQIHKQRLHDQCSYCNTVSMAVRGLAWPNMHQAAIRYLSLVTMQFVGPIESQINKLRYEDRRI